MIVAPALSLRRLDAAGAAPMRACAALARAFTPLALLARDLDALPLLSAAAVDWLGRRIDLATALETTLGDAARPALVEETVTSGPHGEASAAAGADDPAPRRSAAAGTKARTQHPIWPERPQPLMQMRAAPESTPARDGDRPIAPIMAAVATDRLRARAQRAGAGDACDRPISAPADAEGGRGTAALLERAAGAGPGAASSVSKDSSSVSTPRDADVQPWEHAVGGSERPLVPLARVVERAAGPGRHRRRFASAADPFEAPRATETAPSLLRIEGRDDVRAADPTERPRRPGGLRGLAAMSSGARQTFSRRADPSSLERETVLPPAVAERMREAAVASLVARALRREAEREGIDLDEVAP